MKKIERIYFIEAKSPRPHIFSRTPIPRLGIIILATILKGLGYETRIYIEDIAEPDWGALKNADVVCISSITSTAPRMFLLASICRSLNSKVIIVMGGPHSTFLPDESLMPKKDPKYGYADYVVRGEGEEALAELIKHLEEGKDASDILGLSYERNGKIIHNLDRPLIQNLDAAPIPDFSLVHNWKKSHAVPVATSRGCPFNCKFCSVILMFGRQYRFKSIERVIEEIKYAKTRGRHIFFVDDNFAANKERTKALLMKIKNENIEWSAQVRVDAARDAELVSLMKETGCFTVFIGLESINPATLKLYNKKQKLEDIVECIRIFHQAGIHIHGMFVLGADTDNIDTIRATAKFATKNGIDSVQFLMLTPLPGTPVFEKLLQEERLLHQNWEYYDAHHAVFNPFFMSPEELHRETLEAMKKFYSRKRFWRKLLTGDFFYAMITCYGRRLLLEAMKNVNGYFGKVKNVSRIHS